MEYKEYKVQIVETATGEVIKTLSYASYSLAEKAERGVNINLNHDEYHTELLTPQSEDKQ